MSVNGLGDRVRDTAGLTNFILDNLARRSRGVLRHLLDEVAERAGIEFDQPRRRPEAQARRCSAAQTGSTWHRRRRGCRARRVTGRQPRERLGAIRSTRSSRPEHHADVPPAGASVLQELWTGCRSIRRRRRDPT